MGNTDQTLAALVPIWPGMNVDAPFGATTVLGHTLLRLARVEGLAQIVLLHGPEIKTPTDLPTDGALNQKLVIHEVADGLADKATAARRSARHFSPRAWRGGLGGATIWDEILAPAAMVEALDHVNANTALIVGADWPLVDPTLCDALIERHLSEHEQLKLVFNQAPPGLSGCVVNQDLLKELAASGAMIGTLLDYQPRIPQGDPIGKAPCVQISAGLRDAGLRVTYDRQRYASPLQSLNEQLNADDLLNLPVASAIEQLKEGAPDQSASPNALTLELTTARKTQGPLAPAAHEIDITRSEITVETARAIFKQLTHQDDITLTLGGLGDPLLHPEWEAIVMAAHEAGVRGIHIRTDLLVDQSVLERLIQLPIDVVSVNLNADTPATYQALMGVDGHARVVQNLEWLINHRNSAGHAALPWLAPRFAKTQANVDELEDFFDRWTYYAGHAIVESPSTGAGAVADLSVMPMQPPVRFACRQLHRRMTVHCDGAVAMCDEDWRGDECLGGGDDLAGAWAAGRALYDQQGTGDYSGSKVCAGCVQWHRP